MYKFNNASILPVVGCKLLIELGDGERVLAVRTGYISSRTDDMEYKLIKYDRTIKGRYNWAYL